MKIDDLNSRYCFANISCKMIEFLAAMSEHKKHLPLVD